MPRRQITTQRARVLDILTDGKPHTLNEIQARIEERHGVTDRQTSIRTQMSNLGNSRTYRIHSEFLNGVRYYKLERI